MIGGIGGGLDPQSMLAKMRDLQANRPSFAEVDRDGSGGVSRDEFRTAFESASARGLGGPAGLSSDAIFDRIDANGDQQLSADEVDVMQDRAERMQQFLEQLAGGGRSASPFGVSPDLLARMLASSGADSERQATGEESDEDEFDPIGTLLDVLGQRDEDEDDRRPSEASYASAVAAYQSSAFTSRPEA